MDPDHALREGMEAARNILDAEARDEEWRPEDAVYVATALDALNDWLSRGGFLPKPWHDSREAAA